MNNFFINHYDDWRDGPNIFANRLKIELENQNNNFDLNSSNRIAITTGEYKKDCFNMLRLDGLYLDSKNYLGDSDLLNKPIFKCYEEFDHIIFQSEYAKKVYEAFTGTKKANTVIYNGVDDIFFKNEEAIEKPEGFEKVVIASSKWRRHKRIEETIEAFKDKRLKDVALVILGGYKNIDMPNIFSLPMISPYELPKYYKMADAMIHLCWLDCCPNSVIEGLASGLPVICSHNGGTQELVKGDGIVIQLEDDYNYGDKVDLYNPPKVCIETIVSAIEKCLNIGPTKDRKDLHISNVAKKYSNLFK